MGSGIALADEPMEDETAAKPVEVIPAPASPGPPPGGNLNLLTVAPDWPKKPYPVPLRKPHYYTPYRAEVWRERERRDYERERREVIERPRYRKPEVYPEPVRQPRPNYGERDFTPRERYSPAPRERFAPEPPPFDDRFEPQIEVVSPRGDGRRDRPDLSPYEERRYDERRAPAPDYAEPPKRAYGVSIGAPRRPDPDLPLAPDFELNRHRGFGRLFQVLDPRDRNGRGLPAQASSLGELKALGEALKEPGDAGERYGESTMPAGYTFLALLVDHDLTLDLSTSLSQGVRGDEVANTRTPELDLDNVYGAGPIATPYLFKLPYLRTGKRLAGEGAYVRHDLLRAEPKDRPGPPGGAATAIIGDPRDDENLIIAQLHAAFISFHNRTVDVLVSRRFGRQRYKYCGSNVCSIYRVADALPANVKFEIFEKARDHTLHYYHRVIAEDLLPWLIGPERTADLFRRGRDFYFPRGFKDRDGRLRDAYIPVEFAVAAFRFGHSQVNSAYQLRGDYRANLFEAAGGGMQAFTPLTRRQLVDWRYFFEIDEAPPSRFNWAQRIDPYITGALHKLNRNNVVGPKDLGSLPARNLQRGRVFYLPSGQAVAERILPVIEARGALGGGYRTGERGRGNWQAFLLPPNERVRKYLGTEETPLWYYVLQEAELFGIDWDVAYTPAYAGGPKGGSTLRPVAYSAGERDRGRPGYDGGHSLGPVGGTIVGEVLVGLLEHYREKTGKGLGYEPELRGSVSNGAGYSGRQGARPRYLMRNFLIDAGVVEPY